MCIYECVFCVSVHKCPSTSLSGCMHEAVGVCIHIYVCGCESRKASVLVQSVCVCVV